MPAALISQRFDQSSLILEYETKLRRDQAEGGIALQAHAAAWCTLASRKTGPQQARDLHGYARKAAEETIAVNE